MKTIDGYSKEKYTDDSVLLAGGGAKALTDFIGTLTWDSTNKKIQYTPIGGSITDLVKLEWDNIDSKPDLLPMAQKTEAQNSDAPYWIRSRIMATGGNAKEVVYNPYGREWIYWVGMNTSKVYGAILRLSHDGLVQYMHKNGGAANTTAGWSDWKDIITADNIGDQSVNYAASAGAVAWGNVSEKPDSFTPSSHDHDTVYAKLAAHNNLTASGNEFTFASSGFSGGMWINYRTAGGTNGDITEYYLGNGKGGSLGTIIHSGNIGSQSVNYANSAGAVAWDDVTGKPSSFTPSSHSHDYLYSVQVSENQSAVTWAKTYGTNHPRGFVYNTYGTEYSYLFGLRNDEMYGAILKMGYADNYLRMLRVNNTSWQTTDWEKISAGYADSAGDSSTLGGYSASDFVLAGNSVPRKDATYFYPYIACYSGGTWYKITLPYNGTTSTGNRWFMVTMEIVLGGSYSSGASGKIFLQYYMYSSANNGAWSADAVRGIGIGNKLSDNAVQIKYSISSPGIFYLYANGNTYNSMSIQNLTANDSAPAFEFRNVTIETVSSCPASADKTVPLAFIETSSGSNLLYNNQTIIHSGNIGSQTVGSASYADSAGSASSANKVANSLSWTNASGTAQSFNGSSAVTIDGIFTAKYAGYLGTSSANVTYSDLSGVKGKTISAGTANYLAMYTDANTIGDASYSSGNYYLKYSGTRDTVNSSNQTAGFYFSVPSTCGIEWRYSSYPVHKLMHPICGSFTLYSSSTSSSAYYVRGETLVDGFGLTAATWDSTYGIITCTFKVPNNSVYQSITNIKEGWGAGNSYSIAYNYQIFASCSSYSTPDEDGDRDNRCGHIIFEVERTVNSVASTMTVKFATRRFSISTYYGTNDYIRILKPGSVSILISISNNNGNSYHYNDI